MKPSLAISGPEKVAVAVIVQPASVRWELTRERTDGVSACGLMKTNADCFVLLPALVLVLLVLALGLLALTPNWLRLG